MKTGRLRVVFLFLSLIGWMSPLFSQNEISTQDAKLARKTVKSWSVAHDKWDFERLKELYADTVTFYTQHLAASQVLSKITGMFRPSELFKHKITSDIALKTLTDGSIKCDFAKEVTTKGKTKSYPSYLVLSKTNGKYHVIAESDYITDANLHYNYEERSVNKAIAGIPKTGSSHMWVYIFIGAAILAIILFLFFKYKKENAPPAQQKLEENTTTETKKKEETVPVHDNTVEDLNKKKGDEFETYVVSKFDPHYFTSLHWRGDKAAHGHFPKSNKDPDLEFEFNWREYSRQFAVECKYRSQFNTGYIEICDQYKLNHYRSFESKKRMQVYIVIGVGGQPSAPEELFIIPLPHIKTNKIHRQQLNNDYKKSLQSRFFYDTDLHMLT